MTKILEKAFSQAAKLPARDQTALAKWLMAELESDARWQQAFNRTGDQLAALADDALAEHRAGKTRRLGPNSL
jgi:hypothetical protein